MDNKVHWKIVMIIAWKEVNWDYMIYRRVLQYIETTYLLLVAVVGRPGTRAGAYQSPYDVSPMPRSLVWRMYAAGAWFVVRGTGVFGRLANGE